MPVDHIRYDLLAQNALRGMVRNVLSDTARKGLPGEHHFYVTFDTRAEGVRLSPRLREKYPNEMTIVLQHQFWDLKVNGDTFEVGLSFGGMPEHLVVPFAAITSFVDPSVQFALQFEQVAQPEGAAEAPSKPKPEKLGKKVSEKSGTAVVEKSAGKTRRPATNAPARTVPSISPPSNAPVSPLPAPGAARSDDKPDKPSGSGGQVVRLDRFRKKK
jgi:hypothetical protein